MLLFDFLTQLTSTTTPLWPFISPLPTKGTTLPKPVVHDLSFRIAAAAVSCLPLPTRACTYPRPSSQSTVDMPLELILMIIAAADSHHNLDIPLLQSCSLVCKAWSMSVQKMLFRSVTLNSQRGFDSFKNAVDPSTHRGRALGAAIRRLRVVMDYSQPSYLHQHAFAFAVTMCPKLQELDLALYGFAEPGRNVGGSLDTSHLRRRAPLFDAETLSLLHSGPQITSLSFSNWSENQHCIFQLLDAWPSIRSLSMSGTLPHLPSHNSGFFSSSLEALRINFQTPPSMELMDWLLHHSNGCLRTLEFERDPCPDLFDFMMTSYGPVLRSLSIPTCTSFEHVRSLERCEDLRFIRVDHPHVSPLLYKSLPSTINHLAIGVDRDTALQPVIDMVKSRDALEVVTIHFWSGGDNHRLLPALKIACAYRGVDLRMTNDAQIYRAMVKC